MRYLLAFLLITPLVTFADNYTPGTSFYISEDTDNNIVQKISAELWYDKKDDNLIANQEFGVRYTDLTYENPQNTFRGKSVSLLIDKRDKDTWYMGNVGVGQIDGKTFVISDLSVMHFLKPNVIVNAGVFSDVIDAPLAHLAGLSLVGVYTGIEAWNEYGGATTNITQRFMSDGIARTSLKSKIYATLPAGFNAYIADERFWGHSQSDLYWSPNKFERTNVGIEYGARFDKWIVKAAVDVGNTKIDGESDDVFSWYSVIERQRNTRFRLGLRIGEDLAPFNYTYRYASGYFRYAF